MIEDGANIGLRELKRRATENAIEESAIRIALEEGPDAVTVERICHEAFISRSTFFNYFPTRDAAIFGRPLTFESSPRVDEIFNAWGHDLMVGIALAVLESLGAELVNTEVARKRMALYAKYPDTADRISWEIGAARRNVEAVVSDWLVRHPEHQKLDDPYEEAHVVVTMSAMVGEQMFKIWMQRENDLVITLEDIVGARERVRELTAPYSG